MSAKGRIAIVTGGHKGVGKEIVRGLVSKRAKVYIASRNMEKCKEARDEIMSENSDALIEYFHCDLGDFESISKFVRKVLREEKKIHILINTCDVMWGPRTVTKHGIEMQLAINHVGHFLLTNLLLDRLKECAPSRILALTNVAHAIGHINFDDINSEKCYSATRSYAQSKLAIILWTRDLAQQLEGTGVVVNAINPGNVAKAMSQKTGWHGYKTPVDGAKIPLKLALDPEYEEVTGQLFGDHIKDLTACQLRACENMQVASKLYVTIEELINTHQDYIPTDPVKSPGALGDDDKKLDLKVLKNPTALVGWISSRGENMAGALKNAEGVNLTL